MNNEKPDDTLEELVDSLTSQRDRLSTLCDEHSEALTESLQREHALQETIDDLRRQLESAKKAAASAALDAAATGDLYKLEQERHRMTRSLVKSLEHQCEQWRQTAVANERLHNIALDESKELKAKLAARGP